MAESVFCEAAFNYVDDALGTASPVTKQILNARDAELPGWEDCGFELMQVPSNANLDDEQSIASIHYDEIRALATKLTGCDFALVGSHIKRGPEQLKVHEDLGPISFVHSDFADSYGDKMRQVYSAEDAEAKESLINVGATVEDVRTCSRLMIIQFWRNLGPEKMDLPLAFCDARSVPKADLRPFPVQDYAGDGFDFETLGIANSNQHQWYVFPEMNRDEVVAFRTYDSALIGSGNPYWTPHSAFSDPEVMPGEPARLSLEIRATCLFK